MDVQEWSGPFTFVQGADTQLGFMADETWGGKDKDDWSAEIELCKRFVRCCNALVPQPEFVCICGDLVHALPGGVLSDRPAVRRYESEDRYLKQNEDFQRLMKDLAMPLVCVCGNHDVGDVPTPGSIDRYRSMYGSDRKAFWCRGLRCLVINAQLMNEPGEAAEEAAVQDEWLSGELDTLAATPARHSVMFQHIPWFLRQESEPREGYFNLSIELRAKWLPKMKRAGLTHVFCGHYHRNKLARTDDGALEIIVTSAIGRQMSQAECNVNAPAEHDGTPGSSSDIRSGLRLVHVDDAAIRHEYHAFDELEAIVSSPGGAMGCFGAIGGRLPI